MDDLAGIVIGPAEAAESLAARLGEEGLAATAGVDLTAAEAPHPDIVVLLSAGEADVEHAATAARAGARVTARLAVDDSLLTIALYEAGAEAVFPSATTDAHIVLHVMARLGRRRATVRRIGGARIDIEARELAGSGPPVPLTEAETRILDLLAAAGGGYVARDRISRAVFQIPYDKFDRRLDVHISNIRRKIASAGAPLELETARKTGFRLLAAAPSG